MKPWVIARVLVTTDLSNSSIPAVRYARLLADRFSAALTVMYAEPIIYPVDLAGPGNGIGIDISPQHHEQLRREVESHVASVMTGRPYEIEVRIGQPFPSILAAARERSADLIATGTHLRHGWRRALLGSVSEGLLLGSDCPVLTVAAREGHGAAACSISNIMCPINFTEVSRESLQVAARLAQALSARLTIVHVLEANEVTSASEDQERLRHWVARVVQDVGSFRELVVRGDAAERVLDCADDLRSDLLVIGAHHKLLSDSRIVGTTTERLIRFAACPVMVVPLPAMHREARAEATDELAVAEVG